VTPLSGRLDRLRRSADQQRRAALAVTCRLSYLAELLPDLDAKYGLKLIGCRPGTA